MEFWIKAVALIALASFTILSIFLMVSVVKIVSILRNTDSTLSKVGNDIADLKKKVIESLDNADSAVNNINALTSKIDNQSDSLINAIKPFEGMLKNAYEKVGPPVNYTITILSAVSKAVNAFTNKLSKSV